MRNALAVSLGARVLRRIVSVAPNRLTWRLIAAFIDGLRFDPISMHPVTPRDDLRRLGSSYGGWIVPSEIIASGSVCYCAGVGEDVSFDMELIEQFGCLVYAMDPTPRAAEHVADVTSGKAGFTFIPVGLWDERAILRFYAPRNEKHVSHSILNLQGTSEYFEAQCRTVADLASEFSHRELTVLKLDIEGAEYRVLESVLRDGPPVLVICVEFDEAGSPIDRRYVDRVAQSVGSLIGTGYEIVAIEPRCNYTLVHEAATD